MGKRGTSEGSIIRHKKSVLYIARYTVETAISPKRKTIYGKTRAEVSEKLTNALSDRSKGLVFDTDNLTVAEYLQQWLDDSVRGSVMDVTFDSYSRLVNKHLTRGGGSNLAIDNFCIFPHLPNKPTFVCPTYAAAQPPKPPGLRADPVQCRSRSAFGSRVCRRGC